MFVWQVLSQGTLELNNILTEEWYTLFVCHSKRGGGFRYKDR